MNISEVYKKTAEKRAETYFDQKLRLRKELKIPKIQKNKKINYY